ncbi:MAG: hypothetical protein FWG46_06130 [Treponema sp.]|nr:hypothetical protein [Treponema sp.]
MKKGFNALVLLFVILGNLAAQDQGQDNTPVKDDAPVQFFSLQVIPGLDVFHPQFGKVTNIFLLAAIAGKGHNLMGASTASIGMIHTGRVQGLQFSGFFNFAAEDMDGAQIASINNSARGLVRGVQIAGVYNYASGAFYGIQASGLINRIDGDIWGIQFAPVNQRSEGDGISVQVGLVNFSDSGNVIPIGIVNNVKGGMKHFSVFMDDMMFLNAGYRSGSRIFYTHSSYGMSNGAINHSKKNDSLIVSRGGFGFEFPIDKFFIDVDFSRGNILSVNSPDDWWKFFLGSNTTIIQLRLIAGYKLYERFGFFAGISYDYLRQNRNSDPAPSDFCGSMPANLRGKEAHKMGLFGGLQF